MYHRFGLLCSIALLGTTFAVSKADSDEKSHEINPRNIVPRMKESIKLELWSRGSFALESMEDMVAAGAMQRVGPVSYERRQILKNRDDPNCEMSGYCYAGDHFRGGNQDMLSYEERLELKIEELGKKFGQEFLDAIERNKNEHKEDCEASCDMYYCARPDVPLVSLDELLNMTKIHSYSMGPVPPEDFAESFGYVGMFYDLEF